jgi:Domain of unknown function (DUF4326)
MPKRIQRKRTKGWTMPEGVVYVGRGSKWGNPFVDISRSIATASFRNFVLEEGSWSPIPVHAWPAGKIPANWTTIEDVKRELRGKDLACWCPVDGHPCHADVLLAIANDDAAESSGKRLDAAVLAN